MSENNKIEYKFNNGRGAVLCRKCRVIIDENLSYEEAVKLYTGKDRCHKYPDCHNDNDDMRLLIIQKYRRIWNYCNMAIWYKAPKDMPDFESMDNDELLECFMKIHSNASQPR